MQNSNNSENIKGFIKNFANNASDIIGRENLKHGLGLTKSQFEKILNTGKVDLIALNRLSNAFGVVADNFLYQSIDMKAAIAYYSGKSLMPEKYNESAYSKMRTMNNILKVIDNSYLIDSKEYFRKYFQIPVDKWINNDINISTLLLADLYEKIVERTPAQRDDLVSIGLATRKYNEGTAFANIFIGKDFKESYSRLADGLVDYVEESYEYEISSVTDHSVVIKKRLSEKMKDELKVNTYSNHETCLYSLGFAATIPVFGEGNMGKARETKCIHKGDSHCEFLIERQLH